VKCKCIQFNKPFNRISIKIRPRIGTYGPEYIRKNFSLHVHPVGTSGSQQWVLQKQKESVFSDSLGSLLVSQFGCPPFSFLLFLHLAEVITGTNRPMVLPYPYSLGGCVCFPYVRHSAHDRVETFTAVVVAIPSRMASGSEQFATRETFGTLFFQFLSLPKGKQISHDHCFSSARLNPPHSTTHSNLFLMVVFPFFFKYERIIYRHKRDKNYRLHHPHKHSHSHPDRRHTDRERPQEDYHENFMGKEVSEKTK
jgi:hypothetical protein